MIDATVNDIGIVGVVDFAASGVVAGRVLAEELNVLLGGVAGSGNGFGTFSRAAVELFGFVLDLVVQTREDGKDSAFDVLLRFEVGRCDSLWKF